MVEFVTGVYLTLMFVSLYMMTFFVFLTIKNREEFYKYPKPITDYFVSFLIPAFNEEKSIKETVENVFRSDYPKKLFEVIVINDGSTDKTKSIVKELMEKYPRLRLLDKKNSGKADSLNQGIKLAKGELVAVTDADSFPSADSLKKLVGYFNKKEVAAVTSFVRVRNREESIYGKIQSLEYLILGWNRKILDFIDSVYVTNGPLSLYRKKSVVKVGGFDPESITEDIDITWNLLSNGYKTGMCLDASASTIVPTSFKKWFRQRVRWGIGGMQAIKKYKKRTFSRDMFGMFIIPFVSLSIVLSIFGFAFSLYLISKNLFTRFLTIGYSIGANAPILQFETINFYPSVMVFYFLVLFTSSLIYYNYVLLKTKYEKKISVKRFFKLVFYMLVFLAFYPIIWYASVYRYVKKDFRW